MAQCSRCHRRKKPSRSRGGDCCSRPPCIIIQPVLVPPTVPGRVAAPPAPLPSAPPHLGINETPAPRAIAECTARTKQTVTTSEGIITGQTAPPSCACEFGVVSVLADATYAGGPLDGLCGVSLVLDAQGRIGRAAQGRYAIAITSPTTDLRRAVRKESLVVRPVPLPGVNIGSEVTSFRAVEHRAEWTFRVFAFDDLGCSLESQRSDIDDAFDFTICFATPSAIARQ